MIDNLSTILRSRKSRRDILKYTCLTIGFYFFSFFKWVPKGGRFRYLRPPGALAEAEFLQKCIRCGLCGDVCPNQCIRFFEIGSGATSGSPYIIPRMQGCILCMKCNNVCPSGALQPLSDEVAAIRENVRMGVAVLDTDLCYSYNDRICGVCYRACPLQDIAIKISSWEKPVLLSENCVGCGLCERICYHYPQAIKIMPYHELEATRATQIS